MNKKDRVLDLTYYEWSILRWTTSDTRNLLDATGIGIYRELIDRCYAQGSIPAEAELQTRIAKCTPEQLAAVWPLIKSNFRALKNRPERLENVAASVYRANNFRYRGAQVSSGRSGGIAKAKRVNNISSDPRREPRDKISDPSSHLPTNLPTIPTLPTAAPPPLIQLSGEWPETAKVIRSHFPQTDFKFVLNLAERSTQEFLGVPSPKIKLTDQTLAAAVQHCWHDRQYSAPLFLTTVPNCIRSWAENGVQPRDSPRNEAPEETTAERKVREEKQRLELVRRGILQPRAGEAAAGQ